jgi:hypothetical protein
MKKHFMLMLMAAFVSANIFAQEKEVIFSSKDAGEEPAKGFKKEMLFTGGNINIGFFNGVTQLGATPQLGYSLAEWLDAGILFGYTYTSQSVSADYKVRQTILGPGAFARIFPTEFLFASVQYEHNFIKVKQIFTGNPDAVYKVNAGSLLVGLGYTGGKQERNAPYYYFSVSIDVLKNINSPYRTVSNEIYPVVNAGFNIPLFQGGRRR